MGRGVAEGAVERTDGGSGGADDDNVCCRHKELLTKSEIAPRVAGAAESAFL